MDSQIGYYIAFNSVPRLHSADVMDIIGCFEGDAESAWQHPQQWAEALRLSKSAAADILSMRAALDPAQLFAQYLASGCGITYCGADDYPAALVNIYDPPLVLFYHGTLPDRHDLCLALIGSRRASSYGYQVAEIFARDLAYQGAWIVSGMARGIDTICHKAALAAAGKTIAILGTGLDIVYPRENRELYRHICDNGAVISEFPFGTAALQQNFPRRNRIISGLSQGIVVIEADLNSGTMHTVNHALEQGRDVFAVPGPITSRASRGTNRLIKDCPELAMALSSEDIWSHYTTLPLQPMKKSQKVEIKNNQISAEDRRLLNLVTMPMQFDELAAHPQLNLPASTLAATLTMLEIRGLVKQLPGKYYQAVIKNIS
jgi:DNA processing protein